MKSANQIIEYTSSMDFNVTELNADTTKQLTIESPIAGKLLRCRARVYVDDLSNTAALGVLVSKQQQWGEVNAIAPLYMEAMKAWTGSGKVSAVEANPSPRYWFLPSQVDSDLADNQAYEIERTFTINELVNQGDNINVYGFGTSLANVLITGGVSISFVFEFLVAALPTLNSRIPRTSADGMHVTLIANLDNNENIAQYFPPGTGRISNIRVSIWGAIASLFGSNDTLYFGKKLFTDAQSTAEQIYQHTDGVLLVGSQLLDAADPEFNLVLTTYSRELIFVKKGEPMNINYQNTNTTAAKITIEFDFIPDFNSKVDLWYSDFIANVPDASVNIWSVLIPFDMYVEEAELLTSLNDLTVDGYQYVLAVKNVGELLSNVDLITGSMLSSTLIDNAQYSQLPSNILGVMPFSAGQTERPPLPMEVFDYFPAGAWLVVITILETSGTEDLQNVLHIKSRSRVKSSNWGVNYLTGDLVRDQGGI